MYICLVLVPESARGVSPHFGVRSQRFRFPGVEGVACPGVPWPGVASHMSRVEGVALAPGVSLPLAWPGVSSQLLTDGVDCRHTHTERGRVRVMKPGTRLLHVANSLSPPPTPHTDLRLVPSTLLLRCSFLVRWGLLVPALALPLRLGSSCFGWQLSRLCLLQNGLVDFPL